LVDLDMEDNLQPVGASVDCTGLSRGIGSSILSRRGGMQKGNGKTAFTAVLALCGAGMAGWSSVSAQTITEYAIPTAGSAPQFIAPSAYDGVWFTEYAADQVGRISTSGSGAVTEFPNTDFFQTPTAPTGITADGAGILWVLEASAFNAELYSPGPTAAGPPGPTPSGPFESVRVFPSSTVGPFAIATGPDGLLWATENAGNRIASFGPSSSTFHGPINAPAKEYAIPTAGSGAAGIVGGPDGAVWFTESAASQIGRVTSSGSIAEFPIPTANSRPEWMVAGPDGALWFTEIDGNRIGRIPVNATPASPGITEFPLPLGAVPVGIAAGPDGAIWFTEQGANKIGRLTLSGGLTEYPIPTAGSGVEFIVTGPDGNMWFTETSANQIGRIVPPADASPLLAATLPASRSIQVGETATGFATLINAGPAATSCGVAPVTPMPATFMFQTTDPATNQLSGSPNARVSIPAGGAQSFLVAFQANAPMIPTDVMLGFDCFPNTDAAASIVGLNTLALTVDINPVPDIVALAVTATGDGIVDIPGASGTGAFAVATTDVGAGGAITVSADTGAAALPMFTAVCQTNADTGQCIASPQSSVTTTINPYDTPTFSVFAAGTGTVPFDPAHHRVFVRFNDAAGVTRGSTSVAVRTQ
jgi:streptogramin lyase